MIVRIDCTYSKKTEKQKEYNLKNIPCDGRTSDIAAEPNLLRPASMFELALLSLALAAPRLVAVEDFAALPDGWVVAGRSPPEALLELIFAVRQTHVGALHDSLMASSDPASPAYGQHMTNDEVCTRRLWHGVEFLLALRMIGPAHAQLGPEQLDAAPPRSGPPPDRAGAGRRGRRRRLPPLARSGRQASLPQRRPAAGSIIKGRSNITVKRPVRGRSPDPQPRTAESSF